MIARGDLGIEMESSKVPVIQKKMIRSCVKRGIPVVVATQMLNSMIEHSQPTRAEVSDVANAVIDHADATMLSGESAMGRHPVLSVKTMADTIRETEKSVFDDLPIQLDLSHTDQTNVANQLARAEQLKAVIVASSDNHAANQVSRYRPEVPIFVATTNEKTVFQLNVVWGVCPIYFPKSENEQQLLHMTLEWLIKKEAIKKQDTILVVAGKVLGESGHVQLTELRKV